MKALNNVWLHFMQLTVLVLITSAASAQLHANFTANKTQGCPPLVVNFKDSSTGNPTYRKWDLGNGTISYIQDPVASYFNPGTYNVKLIVKNAQGVDSVAKSQYITVNSLPVPIFTISDSTGCFPLKVQFTDTSLAGSGVLQSWQWDFGDGTLSTQKSPLHSYTNGGSFTVILKVVNSLGCTKVVTKPSQIKPLYGVKADFSYASLQGCHTPAPVTFTNKTKGTGTISYKWDFGNGNTSAAENPVNNYQTSGVYSVKLIAKNNLGCTDTMTKDNAINIGFVKADFPVPATVCAGTAVQLINSSTPASFVGSKWYFGDNTSSTDTIANKVYETAGKYDVKLVTDFGSCQDSVTKSVTVLGKPTANFSGTNRIGCAAPLIVKFFNSSEGAVSYKWNFGDTVTSTKETPEHNYNKNGTYPVTLVAVNSSGCTDTLVNQRFVQIAPPKITGVFGGSVFGCIPASINPRASFSDTALVIKEYKWDFGDSVTSTEEAPTHTYTKPGRYNLKLIIVTSTGCTDTLIIPGSSEVGIKPKAEFGADPLDVCAFTPVNFTDKSVSDTTTRWLWNFGDGSTSDSTNPAHMFNDTGFFNIQLIAYNYGCSDTLKKMNYVHVRPPLAKFDTAFLCADPYKRDFIDKSVGATTWNWDFGDGSSSTKEFPSHGYTLPGNYQVMLTVSNGECMHTTKKSVVVIDEKGKLEPSLTEGCVNTRTIFKVSNIIPANIASYTWYFNGLTESAITTANNPVANSYTTAGDRQAAVVLTDILKCKDTIFTALPVRAYGLKANFGGDPRGACFGTTVNFTDSTKTDGTHAISTWKWSFGEGGVQTITAPPFKHDYTAIGNYDVKLLVEDSYGCKDSISKPAFISITKPVANFDASDTALCPDAAVTFTNKSTGLGVGYVWTFGDSTNSSEASPVHKFQNPGTYPVLLAMSDKNGCTSEKSVTVNVFTAKADFTLDKDFSSCPPLQVDITNSSSNYTQYDFDFGDGAHVSDKKEPQKLYTYPGTYSVRLIVKNNGGCTDTLTRKVVIQGPTGVFNYEPIETCNPGIVDFKLTTQHTVNYVYDFNDGNTVFSDKATSSHTYSTPGYYLPKVILEDGQGCQVPIQGPDTIRVNGIQTFIQSDRRLLCDSGYINFHDSTTSNDVVDSAKWDFGDGFYSQLRNPYHHYIDTGFYTVTLIAKSGFGCTDTVKTFNYIKIVNAPRIKITGDTSACEPATMQFKGGYQVTDTAALTWNWKFGNSDTSILQEPKPEAYPNAGTYPVWLQAVNSDGCTGTVSRQVKIRPKPIVDAGTDTTVCLYTRFRLNAVGADSYAWNAHPTLSCTTCATPSVNPVGRVTYHVTGKTLYGCTNEDSVTVVVQPKKRMTLPIGDTLCQGGSVDLKVAGTDMYEWSPSLWLNRSNTAAVQSRPDSTIRYMVVGRDSNNCFKDTGYVKVKVYPIPVVQILNGNSLKLQVGSNIKLKTKSSTDITDWKWFPAQGLSCANCAEPVAAPGDHITYSLTASNAGNCVARDQVTIDVICGSANVFMPNTFSPNGDGENDYFYPRGSGLYNIKTFKIFNRWGQLVFQRSGISANKQESGWNGTFGGVALPTDVYVYVLEVVCANNIVFPFKGNIALIR